MGVFLRRYRKLHIWLLCLGGFFLLFLVGRQSRTLMNAVAEGFTGPLKRLMGRRWGLVPVSGMEVLIALLLLFIVGYIAVWIRAICRTRPRRRAVYAGAMGAVCTGLTIYAVMCLLWGVNYYTDSFQDKSGIRAKEVSVEELYQVTEYFADRLKETADLVDRDDAGVFAVSREEIFEGSTSVYDGVEEEFPFLEFPDQKPKAVYFSRIMSAMNFTGIYCPFTGESNLNVDSPACLLPSTIAHELAHQRGIASEQECNFIAVLAATTCGSTVYAYSGWLLGYIHLSNALYAADQELWQSVWDTLPEGARTDIAYNNAYWAQMRGLVYQASQKVYDSFLKGYGESDGVRSYGTVVDLLVAYYGNME